MAAALAASVLVLTLAACTGTSATSASAPAEMPTMAAAGTTAGADAAAAPNFAGGEAGGAAAAGGAASEAPVAASAAAVPGAPPAVVAAAPGDARQIIRTADLGVRLEVPAQGLSGSVDTDTDTDTDADAAARKAALTTAVTDARAAVTAAGGLVASSDGSGDRTTLGLRVPVDAYDAMLDRLAGLGVVDHRSESSQDVTAELVDVASRIDTMSASISRVRALLAQATDVGQVVAIEGELARREADLESLQRQRAALSGQVALSTVTLTLTAVTSGAAVTPGGEERGKGFLAGLSSGWSALLGLLTGLGTAAGALLPFLPFVVVGGWLVWWFRRRRRPAGAARSTDHPAAAG